MTAPPDRATMTETFPWRIRRAESRARYLAKFDAAGAADYYEAVGTLSEDDERAYQSDIERLLPLAAGADVLDAGTVTALEPAPEMLALLRSHARLQGVATIEGFCDAVEDRSLFPPERFDAIVSRQLANGLYDPLGAFANWAHWLKPGGAVLVIEGIYGRDAWTGAWSEEVDVLPLSATQSRATVPYLLEAAGFRVESVDWMDAVNRRPATRTPRYAVLARRVTP